MTSIIHRTGIYQDSMVLMEQGTSCIDIEIQNAINSLETKGLKSSKKDEQGTSGTKKISQQSTSEVKAVAHHETVKNEEAIAKAEDFIKQQSATEKHCTETDTVEREAKTDVSDASQKKEMSDLESIVGMRNDKRKQGSQETQSPSGSADSVGDVRKKGSLSAKVVGIGKPEYPRECLVKGHEGKVVVEITIKADGSNGSTTVIASSGCKYMDRSTLDFLKKSTLMPKMIMGVAVDSKKKIAFRFKITEAGNENTPDN